MIQSGFATLDWLVFAAYFLMLAITSFMLSQGKIRNSREYFVGGNSMPMLAVALSVLATSQSAATFLGGPEYSYRNDLTFLGFYFSAFLAVIFVAKVLIPRFYAIKAVTVYELLEIRYGENAKRQAGVMFLIGRLFASGARLYIGALAVSMILFNDITFLHVIYAISILMIGALAYTYFGGVKSVIFSDIIQAITYIGAGVAVLVYLYMSLDYDMNSIISMLSEQEKLRLIDWELSFSSEGKFNIFGLLTGWLLLNIAAYGLDQDMTQRVLSCRDAKAGQRSLYYSIVFTIPVVMLFLAIGLLLYLFYQQQEVVQNFKGENVTIFMYYILNEMPDGLRGLVTVGAVAAALSSTNSVLGAMSSVAVEDIYRPLKTEQGSVDEAHFVKAARVGVLAFAVALSLMAMLSYIVHQASDLPLLSFALGVMAFAYSGLLGVYFSALFTSRGSEKSVLLALISGFVTVLSLQPYVFGANIGFAWQIVIGTIVSFATAQLKSSAK
ncbi:MAG: sodium:solute symporter [Campylobacterota bacterium]|nr:sodium:solute symporter [Campylobacterota bacterium]